MKAFKTFIKPFEAPQRSLKTKIQVNFLSLSGIGRERVKLFDVEFTHFVIMCYESQNSLKLFTPKSAKYGFRKNRSNKTSVNAITRQSLLCSGIFDFKSNYLPYPFWLV